MRKLLYLDFETTGLDSTINDFVQISAIVEIDGEIVDGFNCYTKPREDKVVDPVAMEINKIDFNVLNKFKPYSLVYKKFDELLSKYVNRYQRNKNYKDKFTVVGHNVNFDIGFLEQMYLDFNNGSKDEMCKKLYSLINRQVIDNCMLYNYLRFHNLEKEDLVSLKLDFIYKTIFKADSDMTFHNSAYDILATRNLKLYADMLCGYIKQKTFVKSIKNYDEVFGIKNHPEYNDEITTFNAQEKEFFGANNNYTIDETNRIVNLKFEDVDCKIDLDDYFKVKKYNWQINKTATQSKAYIYSNVKKQNRKRLLHRYIIEENHFMTNNRVMDYSVLHRDNNTLNNCKANLYLKGR